MKHRIIILLATIPFLFIRCEPDPLPVNNITTPPPALVISTQLIPSAGVVVSLSKTLSALDVLSTSNISLSQLSVSDAIVTLHHNQKIDTLRMINYGVYQNLQIVPTINTDYTLHVKTKTMGEASAQTQVLRPVLFDSIQTEYYIIESDTIVQINYSFIDPIEKNYFMINVQKLSRFLTLDDVINPSVFTHLVDDSNYDNQRIEDNFKVLIRSLKPSDTILVSLTNINKTYYDFLKFKNNRNSFIDFLGEPFNYPTNITGGYGFFTLHIPDTRFIVLE